jgi:hypothetical protein
MKKETAIEWLIGELNGYDEDCEIFQIAKAIEREQIESAYTQGCWDEIDERMESCVEESCKRYYNETYKGGEQ